MKLIAKYNRINIIATIVVLLAASVCYYFIVRYVLIHQLDNTLKVEESEILDYVKANNKLPQETNYRDQNISFEKVNETIKRKFSNINIYNERHHEYIIHRQIEFPVAVNGELYKTSVLKPEGEVEELILLIVFITIGVIILLFLILFITNRFLLRKLWQPFYETLSSIKQFNLSNKKTAVAQQTDIEEFRELDNAVNTMTARITKDYESLKNFTDNASHEMQTPLAILNSKLDLLIQEPNLTEIHLKQLQAMYDAIGRLTKLNQSLLLLTKIENNQFKKEEPLQLDILIKEKLIQFEDLIKAKNLQMNAESYNAIIRMNYNLADILINNLLSNAIRHNINNGIININIDEKKLVISNTGSSLSFNADDIFERFKKGETTEGLGLGLAIVKQICDNYYFTISYQFNNNLHIFVVDFSS
jgi:signal transduction histidine kinase